MESVAPVAITTLPVTVNGLQARYQITFPTIWPPVTSVGPHGPEVGVAVGAGVGVGIVWLSVPYSGVAHAGAIAATASIRRKIGKMTKGTQREWQCPAGVGWGKAPPRNGSRRNER